MSTDRPPFFPLTVARFLVGYVTYFGANFLFLAAGTPLLLALTPLPRLKQRLLELIVHDYLGFLTKVWLPLWRVYRLVEVGQPPAQGPAVYVANHRGFLDAPLLLGMLRHTGVVVKSRYTRWLLPGLLARHFDFVSLDPAAPASVLAALDRCRTLLAAGHSLLVFPEGTRARTGRLGRFKNTAFRVALEAGVPVVPVIVHSTEPFMAKVPGSVFPRRPNLYRVRFLDADRPVADDTVDALADRVYRRMARELAQLDQGTVWATR